METLIPFLKHSTALDLVVILLVILISVMLIPAGILTAVLARTRKPIYLFVVIALLPLLLALLGTYLRFRGIENAIAEFPEVGSEVVAEGRQEAWIVTYIGVAGTAIAELIGVTGLVLKKDRRSELDQNLLALRS